MSFKSRKKKRKMRIVRLTHGREVYDADDRRIALANIVIDPSGVVIKDRKGVAGRDATLGEIGRATPIAP